MSVATELPPVFPAGVHLPAHVWPEHRSATVLDFRARAASAGSTAVKLLDADATRPAPARQAVRAAPERSVAHPVVSPARLTVRGCSVLAVVFVLAAAAVVLLAWASVPSASTGGDSHGSATVTVHDGDTLWSIASRLSPQRDPRDVVASLERLNGLSTTTVHRGQVLRTG